MSTRVSKDVFVDIQVDPNFIDDDEFTNPDIDPHYVYNPNQGDPTPQYSPYIPPRTNGGKRKKTKSRHQASETIWTIVSEQDKHLQQSSKSKRDKEKSSTLESESSSSKHVRQNQKKSLKKKKGDKGKQKSSEDEEDALRKSIFLNSPIFHTDLANWTLPRVELWCKDPNCQINIELRRQYFHAHQGHLTQLQVQELQHQQFLQNYPPHHHHHHHHHHRQPQPLQRRQSDPFVLPPDLPSPASLSRKNRLASIPQGTDESAFQHRNTSGIADTRFVPTGARQCTHPFHQGERDFAEEVVYREVIPQLHHPHHGNTHVNMTLNHSMNNLSAHQDHSQTGGGPSGSKNIMPTSTSVPVNSGGSSAKTSTVTISSSASLGGQPVSSSTSSGIGDSVQSSRENYSSSSSTSSTTSSSEGVSSGSTFVTDFDSSESRGSSVPSSLNKPPHPNIMNNMENSNNKNSTSNNSNHRSSTLNNAKSYGDSTTAPSSGYPSLPYIPTGYRKPGICPSCNGLVPAPPSTTNHHLVPVDPLLSAAATASGGGGPLDIIGAPHHHNNPLSTNNLKSDNNNAFWNFAKFQHPLQRDHSFHSVGGFTLNGQYNTQVKKRRVVKFCSSHKIALVVSTFSLMVTIGLIITLILMKKRGMMDTMDMMPT